MLLLLQNKEGQIFHLFLPHQRHNQGIVETRPKSEAKIFLWQLSLIYDKTFRLSTFLKPLSVRSLVVSIYLQVIILNLFGSLSNKWTPLLFKGVVAGKIPRVSLQIKFEFLCFPFVWTILSEWLQTTLESRDPQHVLHVNSRRQVIQNKELFSGASAVSWS